MTDLRTETVPRPLIDLFGELQDLKRQAPAHLDCSIATDLFRRSWRGLLNKTPPRELALRMTAEALSQILFPGCGPNFWPRCGLSRGRVVEVLREGILATAGRRISPGSLARLSDLIPVLVAGYFDGDHSTGFALPPALETLCRQARAGATRPGVPRLLLVPPEMHSEHCMLTALHGVLLADVYGADPGRVFVCALAHHLHNALLPDCGFAGEVCLGPDLDPVIEHCRERAIQQLPEALGERVRTELRFHDTIGTPEGRAESAADVLDRVLDVKWRTRAAAVTDADILDDMDLVHPGPLRDFQDHLLQTTGLWKLK